MSLTKYHSKNTFYRQIVNATKKSRFLYSLVKALNPARRIEIKRINDHLKNSENDWILDVGCGDGCWTNYFSRKVKKITGIDPFESDLNIAKQFAVAKTEFFLGTGENIPFQDNTFNKVISICVFEHIPDDVKAFREINRVLIKDGFLLATVDSLDSPYISDHHRNWHMKTCYCNQLYTLNSISNKLKEAGFSNVQAHYFMGTRLGVWWEKMTEKFGAFILFLAPFIYPFILLLENSPKKSGYKIFVKAMK